jgi:hypothetical protein
MKKGTYLLINHSGYIGNNPPCKGKSCNECGKFDVNEEDTPDVEPLYPTGIEIPKDNPIQEREYADETVEPLPIPGITNKII